MIPPTPFCLSILGFPGYTGGPRTVLGYRYMCISVSYKVLDDTTTPIIISEYPKISWILCRRFWGIGTYMFYTLLYMTPCVSIVGFSGYTGHSALGYSINNYMYACLHIICMSTRYFKQYTQFSNTQANLGLLKKHESLPFS